MELTLVPPGGGYRRHRPPMKKHQSSGQSWSLIAKGVVLCDFLDDNSSRLILLGTFLGKPKRGGFNGIGGGASILEDSRCIRASQGG